MSNAWFYSDGLLAIDRLAIPDIFIWAPKIINSPLDMLLIGRIGADHAAYALLAAALILSTFFESYRWSASGILGVVFVLFGNLVILTPADRLQKAFRKIGGQ